MGKLGIKILLSLFVVIAIFAVGEVVLRQRGALSTDMDKFDKDTGLYILKPNSQYRYKTDCFDTTIKANFQGFNDEEFNLEKPDGVFRIVILGDSFVEEKAVPIQKSFANILEEKLNQLPGEKKRFEVYSFGKGGNGTFKNYLYLNQYALKYKPDLVILGFLAANDFRDDYDLKNEIFNKDGKIKTASSKSQKLAGKSVLLTWFNYKWRLMETNLSLRFKSVFLPQEAVSQVPFDFQVFLNDYPEGWNTIWDLEKTLLLQFRKTSEDNNSKFLIVSFNDIWRAYPELLAQNKEFGQYLSQFNLDFDKPEKILTDFTREQGVSYFSLVEPLRERINKEKQMTFYYPCDAHWNELGNQWAGELIAQFLTSGQGRKLIDINP